LDLLVAPDGANYGRIFDLAIDGNKNNNSAGYGFRIADGSSGQESQWIVDRCYFHDNPYSNVYLGVNRRANKILNGVYNYSGAGDGITVAGSDNTVQNNICGSNARAGIVLGTTITQNWAASSSPNAASVAHVIGNDIYGNLVGVALALSASDCIVAFNGIDRNLYQGITVYDGTSNQLISNSLHSNGTSANNVYAHIDVASGVTSVGINNNNFGPLDSGITNVASYCLNVATSTNRVIGNIGSADSTASVGGLVNASSSTPSYTTLAMSGAKIQGSGNDIFGLYTSSGTLVHKVTGAGTPVYSGGGVQFNVSSGHVFGSSTALPNTLASFISANAAYTLLATKNTSGQSANILTCYQSDGTTVLLQVDKAGFITAPVHTASGLTGATSTSRYAGATAGGAPVSGTFAVGDFVVDNANGAIYICTAAGTPGTWVLVGGSAGVPLNPAQQLFGYLGWTFDNAMISGNTTLSSAGVVTLCKIPWPNTLTVTNIVIGIGAGGGSLTSGQCFAGIYNSSGTLLGISADQSGTWNASGAKTMALNGGVISVAGGGAGGFIYVGLLWNGTTSPSVFKAVNNSSVNAVNLGLSAASSRSASNGTGNTSLPSTLTLSSSVALANAYWAALS
jgi:hypothetical protein